MSQVMLLSPLLIMAFEGLFKKRAERTKLDIYSFHML